MYEWFNYTKSNYKKSDFYKIYFDFPRKELIKKIEIRTQEMIKKGAIQEAKKILNLGVGKNKSAYKAIGINEVKEYLAKKIKKEDVIDKISIKTRQYAKRQSTWGRGHMQEWNKMNPSSLDKFLKKF